MVAVAVVGVRHRRRGTRSRWYEKMLVEQKKKKTYLGLETQMCLEPLFIVSGDGSRGERAGFVVAIRVVLPINNH